MNDPLAHPPAATLGPPPPPPPRNLTAASRRRSWTEPQVGFWAIVGLFLLICAIGFAVSAYVKWSAVHWLIHHGTAVNATVYLRVDAGPIRGRPAPPGTAVRFEFPWEGGKATANGTMPEHGRFIVTGSTIPIHVDPNNPHNATADSQPPPLMRQMLGPLFLLPVVAILVIVVLVGRWRRLGVWRKGEAFSAIVVEATYSAMAPRSRVVRCAPVDLPDQRLLRVYIPQRLAEFNPGDALWLIAPPGRPHRAIPAIAYQ